MLKKKSEKACSCKEGKVFTPYRTVKGKRVYKPDGGVYVFNCTWCSLGNTN